MKYLLSLLFVLLSVSNTSAQNFDDYFVDETLRIDYIFSGKNDSQRVSLSEMSRTKDGKGGKGWAGRKNNLDKLYLNGNGQVLVTDLASGTVIYRNAFSTLFQEWKTTPESKLVDRAFENTFLIPFPKTKVAVSILLRNRDGVYQTYLQHVVDPKDILIKRKGLSAVTPHRYLHRGDSTRTCIHVVILAEGYTTLQMVNFRKHAKVACEQILAHEPFATYRDRFNFVAVESVSEDSGVSVPIANKWKNTAVGAHFDTFYQNRYLTTPNVKRIHDLLSGISYQHVIILANTDVYGGGGIFNAYTLTSTDHDQFGPVVVHEFGHSFGGLADEYFYATDLFNETYNKAVEPWEPNITTLVDFGKWDALLPKYVPVPTPINEAAKYPLGVYEGAGYSAKGIYRPAKDCRMKTNECKAFCPACRDALAKMIRFYTE